MSGLCIIVIVFHSYTSMGVGGCWPSYCFNTPNRWPHTHRPPSIFHIQPCVRCCCFVGEHRVHQLGHLQWWVIRIMYCTLQRSCICFTN